MSWNYRIVKHNDGSGYGLHEVYYEEDDLSKPRNMTAAPVEFTCGPDEDPQEIVGDLLMAVIDFVKHGVLDEPESWE